MFHLTHDATGPLGFLIICHDNQTHTFITISNPDFKHGRIGSCLVKLFHPYKPVVKTTLGPVKLWSELYNHIN